MRHLTTAIAFLLLNIFPLFSQGTGIEVYQILQNKCVQCHGGANAEAGLDLQGTASTLQERMAQVYQNIVGTTPTNAAAAARGDQYVYPGRADRSFLFRKINQGLEPTVSLEAGEEQAMPPYDSEPLTDVEKELIRQWIQFGAPPEGEVVEVELLEEYYEGNAQESFPDGPPEAPAPGEGFQIKMGPFFMAPSEEIEFFQKYELDLPANVDVNRLDIKIGTFSHHFIVYDFPGGGGNIPAGLRLEADHSDIGLVAAVQEQTDLRLPSGTAFIWDNDIVLDLNSHYINYSASTVYKAEAYVNVYTQPAGTAAQEMYTELIPNLNIYIPNNGNPITETEHLTYNIGDIYLWGIMGHTHQYGTGYKVYERLPGGQQGELIYDAACAQGIPGCTSPFFDYQHIPMRYIEPLMPVTMSPLYGLIHEASWVNDGPTPVYFGPTSDDEMMVVVLMYTSSLDGVSAVEEPVVQSGSDAAFPNPTNGLVTFRLPGNGGASQVLIFNSSGQQVAIQSGWGDRLEADVNHLPVGLYFYRLQDSDGRVLTGKLIRS